jgi:hypothetical protein
MTVEIDAADQLASGDPLAATTGIAGQLAVLEMLLYPSSLTVIAQRHGYVCYPDPGPVPGVGTVYWGRPVGVGVPQRALSVDLGPESNVTRDRVRPGRARADVRGGRGPGPTTGEAMQVRATASLRPPWRLPLWAAQGQNVRRRFRDSSTSTVRSLAQAQAQVDAASDAVIADCELDGGRYGDMLPPRPGRRTRRRLVARRLVVRAPGGARAGARLVPAALHALPRGLRLDGSGGADMKRFCGKYRGTVEKNVDGPPTVVVVDSWDGLVDVLGRWYAALAVPPDLRS